MKHIILSLIAVLMLFAQSAEAQTQQPDNKYSIRVHADIGLGNCYSATSAVENVSMDKSGNTGFGADFRYRLFNRKSLSMGINAGMSYFIGSQTFRADNLSFDYAAGSNADMDGDTYQRYTTVDKMSQKISLGTVGIPVFLDLNWQFSTRVSLYAKAGISLMMPISCKTKDIDGSCYVYGIYPQYGNLKMDDAWLNDFGRTTLQGADVVEPELNTFIMSVGGGAGFRFWIYGPLSLECGVNYEYGLQDILKSGTYASGTVTEDTAPVVYTVENGRRVKSLAYAMSQNRLSSLNLNIGIIISF